MEQDALERNARANASAWRTLSVLLCMALALAAIGHIFWQQDLRYSLPTPRPHDLQQPPLGEPLSLPASVTTGASLLRGKPVLLHFYNPQCPCSRFNRDHVQALLNRFGDRVQFVSVIEATADAPTDSGLPMPHVVDDGGKVAAALGVYSTPQAVLLDASGKLCYRGNFNTSRYCTTPQTQFVRLAIEAMLLDQAPLRDPLAETAYGCCLPGEECRDER